MKAVKNKVTVGIIVLAIIFLSNSFISADEQVYNIVSGDAESAIKIILTSEDIFGNEAVRIPLPDTVLPEEAYDFVIITNNELVSFFQELADYKNSFGIKTTI